MANSVLMMLKALLHIESAARTRNLRFPGLPVNSSPRLQPLLPLPQLQTSSLRRSLKRANTFISEEEQLLVDDLFFFQRPLYDIHRAWRAPLLHIVRRLSQGILAGSPAAEEKCTLAFLLLLPGLVVEECHLFRQMDNTSRLATSLLAHLVQDRLDALGRRLRRFIGARTGPGSGPTRTSLSGACCRTAQYRSRSRPFGGGGLLTTPDRTPPP